MKNNSSFRHVFKVLPSHSVSYWMNDSHSLSNRSGLDRKKNKIRAQMSRKAKSNLNNCFNWLHLISNVKTVYSRKEKRKFNFRFSFITLTLSDVQIHSDAFIKKYMLDNFLMWLYRAWNCNSYIWKAETQNNGNIHFHITTNKFIHWKSVRSKWNMLLSAYGYCKVFQDGSNDKGDSATEIRAVRNEKEIKKYIAAYVSKKDTFKKRKDFVSGKVSFIHSESCELNNHFYAKENYRQVQCSTGETREYKRTIKGRLWGASNNLNQSAVIVSDLSGSYDALSSVMLDSSLVDLKEFDFHKIYLYKKKVFRYLPISIRNEFKCIVQKIKQYETSQQFIEIDTFY